MSLVHIVNSVIAALFVLGLAICGIAVWGDKANVATGSSPQNSQPLEGDGKR